ncbi:hypothetical protein ACS5PK_00630 [Roseateles sp. DB2]|uniref:hypothetical protein n=1 Tax=Roseateles sp. DB2 TaxID=3453717 RepID=UPI003EEAAC50
MSPKYYLRIVQFGQAQQPYTLRAGAGREGKALVLQAQTGMRFQLLDALTQEAPAKLNISRQGKDLLLTLPDGDVGAPDLVIRGYFEAQDVAVMGRSASGDWRVYDNTGAFSLTQANGISPAALPEGQVTAAALASPPGTGWFEGEKGWVLAGVGTLGLVAGGASLSKKDDASAFDKIKAFAQHAANAVTPTVTDYANAGIHNVDANNVGAVNLALQASQLDMGTSSNVQTVVDAYVKILAEANGSSPDLTPDADPTTADYQNIGVLLGALQGKPAALALLNDAIKGITIDSVDTIAELKAIVAVVQKVMNIAAGVAPASALSTDDLALLGIRSQQLEALHAKDNLGAIVSAISATSPDGSGVSSVSKLVALMSAYDRILSEANGNTADTDVSNDPTAADFAAIGADIGRAQGSATALTMLDDVIGELQRSSVDTVEKINGIASTLDKLAVLVAKPSGDASAPLLSAADFARLGLSSFASSGANNQAVAELLSVTVRDMEPGEVDTLAKLQSLASMELLRVWARDSSPSKSAGVPTADDYEHMGVVHNDASGTPVALAASDATALNSFADNLPDARLDSLVEIQQLAAALFRLLNEANGTNADGNAAVNPTAGDFATLGVAGHAGDASDVLQPAAARLLADAVATRTSDQVDTPKELSALAGVVDHVLDVAAGASAPSSLSLADFSTLGVTGVSSNNLAMVGTLLQGSAHDGSGVDSVAELQSVVSLARVVRYADEPGVSTGGANEGGLPTFADYKAISAVQSLVVASNVNAYNSAVDAHVGSQVDDPLTELLPLIRGYNTVLAVAQGAASPSALNVQDLTATGLVGVTGSNVATIGSLIQATARDGSGVDTLAELQSVTSLARVVRYADDAKVEPGQSNEGGLPTLADYRAIAAVQSLVEAGNVSAYNSAVEARVGSQVDNASTELLPLIRGYNAILTQANGSMPDPVSGTPTLTDYASVGVNLSSVGTVPVSNLLVLMNEAVGSKLGSEVDTIAELNAIRTSAVKVMALAAISKSSGGSDADAASVGGFSVSDLARLGLDVSLLTQAGLSDAVRAHRLADVRDHIIYSDNFGTGVEYLSQLQAMINATSLIVA